MLAEYDGAQGGRTLGRQLWTQELLEVVHGHQSPIEIKKWQVSPAPFVVAHVADQPTLAPAFWGEPTLWGESAWSAVSWWWLTTAWQAGSSEPGGVCGYINKTKLPRRQSCRCANRDTHLWCLKIKETLAQHLQFDHHQIKEMRLSKKTVQFGHHQIKETRLSKKQVSNYVPQRSMRVANRHLHYCLVGMQRRCVLTNKRLLLLVK